MDFYEDDSTSSSSPASLPSTSPLTTPELSDNSSDNGSELEPLPSTLPSRAENEVGAGTRSSSVFPVVSSRFVLVIGGLGYIGSHTVLELLREGHNGGNHIAHSPAHELTHRSHRCR